MNDKLRGGGAFILVDNKVTPLSTLDTNLVSIQNKIKSITVGTPRHGPTLSV